MDAAFAIGVVMSVVTDPAVEMRHVLAMRYKAHRREALCIAAMLNSTLVDRSWLHDMKAILLGELEDYFVCNPVESAQFDQAKTLQFIESLDGVAELGGLLHDMGKCPFNMFFATEQSANQWHLFC